nr:hypothetical protein Iba_chr15bCG5890 [Ipomoea batatas]
MSPATDVLSCYHHHRPSETRIEALQTGSNKQRLLTETSSSLAEDLMKVIEVDLIMLDELTTENALATEKVDIAEGATKEMTKEEQVLATKLSLADKDIDEGINTVELVYEGIENFYKYRAEVRLKCLRMVNELNVEVMKLKEENLKLKKENQELKDRGNKM